MPPVAIEHVQDEDYEEVDYADEDDDFLPDDETESEDEPETDDDSEDEPVEGIDGDEKFEYASDSESGDDEDDEDGTREVIPNSGVASSTELRKMVDTMYGKHIDSVIPVEEKDAYYRTHDIVHPKDHITSNILSMYEVAAIIATRTAQLERGALSMVPQDEQIKTTDTFRRAVEELTKKYCPLMVKREVGRNVFEIHDVNMMQIPAALSGM